jgi:hypothetical protein
MIVGEEMKAPSGQKDTMEYTLIRTMKILLSILHRIKLSI